MGKRETVEETSRRLWEADPCELKGKGSEKGKGKGKGNGSEKGKDKWGMARAPRRAKHH